MAFLWLINGGDPNYLLSGMILQVGPFTHFKSSIFRAYDSYDPHVQGLKTFIFQACYP